MIDKLPLTPLKKENQKRKRRRRTPSQQNASMRTKKRRKNCAKYVIRLSHTKWLKC